MKNKKEILIIVILILIQSIIYVFVGANKSYLHIDEAYSYGLTNYDKVEIEENADFYNTWHNKEYYEDYLTVNEDEIGDFKPVYENQKNDVHPPLYYLLLRIAMSFSVGSFSKWAGFGLNIVIYAFITILAYLILKKMLSNEKRLEIKAAILAFVLIGGLKRIAAVAEKLVPFMAFIYIIGALVIIVMNIKQIPTAFVSIFKSAFSLQSFGGGIMGYGITLAIRYGVARGVFSNEAGLGSSVMVHSSADVEEPVKQGLWGIFEVFFDTIIICTLTALVILCTGALDIGGEGATITMNAFTKGFGSFGGIFLSFAILLFAFTTVLSWSYYGQRAVEYLFGQKMVIVYQILFIAVVVVGSISAVQIVWDLSDTFNGLMALPNLIGILLLSPKVVKITKNYIARRFQKQSIPPILSADQEQRK